MHTSRKFVSLIAVATAWMVWAAPAWAQDAPSTPRESELISLLQSDSPSAEKALACKRLAVFGSEKAVPELAKLLTNDQLASWARIPLEVIPGAAADEALRKALDATQGRLLIGVINSIGVRRDAGSAEALIARLADKNGEIASASAVALGNIGNAAATQALRKALATTPLAVRSAVAEGCILCAERLLSEGKSAEAAEIYDEVRKAEVSRQRILEATRGAILARKEQGIPILVEQLRSSDQELFEIALGTAREISGGKVDEALASELTQAAPERAALILVAMADRPKTVVLAAVMKAAGEGAKPVRIAALGALGRVGNATSIAPLLAAATDADSELAAAAKKAIASLPGSQVDGELLERLNKATGKEYPLLLEVVGQRRIAAVPALLKAIEHSDKAVRSAALIALGNTVRPDNLSVLIAQAVSPKQAEDGPIAQEALKIACIRMPDREACASELTAALNRSPAATKPILLEILGAVGGTKSLQALAAAAKTSDAQMQDVSTRLLGEWMTIDAAPVLLDLTKSAPGEKYQNRALRGYLRIARQFVMPDPQRAEMCAKAFEAARQPAEQRMVLDIVKRYPFGAMIPVVITAAKDPQLKDESREVAMLIATKLRDGDDSRRLLSAVGLDRVKVEIVAAEYGVGSTQKDVTEILRKQVSDLPLVTLPKSDYNSSLGGDPAPNEVKRLKIRYRINGKDGEASFAENAPIILPLPK